MPIRIDYISPKAGKSMLAQENEASVLEKKGKFTNLSYLDCPFSMAGNLMWSKCFFQGHLTTWLKLYRQGTNKKFIRLKSQNIFKYC